MWLCILYYLLSISLGARTGNWKAQVTTGKHDNKAEQISRDVNSRTHGSPKIFKKCPHIQTCLSLITPGSASGNDRSLLFRSRRCNRSSLCLLYPSPTSRGNWCAHAVKVRNLLVRVPDLRGLAPITRLPLTALTPTHPSLCLDNARF